MKVKVEMIRERLTAPEINIKGKTDKEIMEEIRKLPQALIVPNETDIYFIVSTKTGNGECCQKCEHCVFQAIPEFEIDWQLAKKIVKDLQRKGYRIGLTPGDTFSEKFLSIAQKNTAGSAYRREDRALAAWSSGARIAMEKNWKLLLETVYNLGFGAIQINGQNAAGTPLPFKGVPSSMIVRTAIERIKKWNTENPMKNFKIGITFTIGKYNFKKEYLKKMLDFCLKNELSIRYNCFVDFTEKFPNYQLEKMEVRQFYRHIAKITAGLDSQIEVTVASDFGDNGQEFLIPESEKGNCGAGKKLFRIAKIGGEIIIAACVERMAPIVGKLKIKNGQWTIEWNEEKLKQLHYLKPFLYGCFGGIGYRHFSETAEKIAAERIIFG